MSPSKPLLPCPRCHRHVRSSAESCPFCDAALSFASVPDPVRAPRLGRAATFAFGAAVLGATSLVACGGESESPDDQGGAGSSGASGSGGTGNQSGGSSGAAAAGPTAGTAGLPDGGGPMPVYGAAPAR